MTIIVTTQGSGTVKLQPTSIEREEVLQRYIHEYPESLPLEEIREDVRLCVLCREFPTTSGPIDALGVDHSGEIYIIETKLFKNPDKRTVIAQAMDYGSALWRDGSLITRLESVLQQRGARSLRQQLTDFADDQDVVETILERMTANQASGVFRFVVLMDKIHDRLKDLITFINENSKFTVYAVELEFYRHDQVEIVLPRLYGAEAKKDIPTVATGAARRKWDESSFFTDSSAKLSASEARAIRQVYESALSWAEEISWGTGTTAGSFSPKRRPEFPRAPFAVYSDGRLLINFAYFNAGSVSERVEEFARNLRDGGYAIPGEVRDRHVTLSPVEWAGSPQVLDNAMRRVLLLNSDG